MHERRYRRGDAIFQPGDPCDVVYLVRSGTVRREDDNAPAAAPPASFGPGSFFGQDGLLTGGTRAFRARAIDDVALLAVARPEVLERLESDAEAFRALLETLSEPPCAPVPVADPAEGPEDEAAASTSPLVRLKALDEDVVRMIGAETLEIRHLPYVVGRRVESSRPSEERVPDLRISESAPFWLSRRHFSIELLDQKVVVRDCGSIHGTIVNGRRIGGRRIEAIAKLDKPKNKVLAGRNGSPFLFEITVVADGKG